MSFGKDFIWGVSTSAYQIEGACNEDGRGESIWDIYTHQPDKIKDSYNGDVTCDHYHRFREDVKLMRELGIKAYRMSISWTRIFPDGIGKVNEKGVKFYSDLIDELIANGIEPYITLFHWDYPYALHKKGGWLNDDCVAWFRDYAEKVVELYSDRVTNYITMNEPQCFIGGGFLTANKAPGITVSYRDAFQMAHNVLKAHGAAVKAMRKSAKQPIKIGYAPTGSAHYPLTESKEDIEAARQAFFESPDLGVGVLWTISWWSDPVMLGRYPEDGIKKYREYLPKITDEDMELISQPIDFYCQNIYNGRCVESDGNGGYRFVKKEAGAPKTASQWGVTPKCMKWGPKFIYDRYNAPILISENGMSSHDWKSLDGKVHDPARIDFLSRYLLELERAKDDGVDVRGYFIWTFMDNFEWELGYTERFGIVYVDFDTGERIPKDSAYWFKDFTSSK